MKKTEFITFRTNAETKQALEAVAEEKKWTISFLVEEIVAQWISQEKERKNKQDDSI